MLIVRKEQIEAFESATRERFVREMVEHVRGVFPEEASGMDDGELGEAVERGIDKAAAYDITGEREVAMFIDLEIGMNTGDEYSHLRDWIQETLVNEGLDQSAKMDLIYARLQD